MDMKVIPEIGLEPKNGKTHSKCWGFWISHDLGWLCSNMPSSFKKNILQLRILQECYAPSPVINLTSTWRWESLDQPCTFALHVYDRKQHNRHLRSWKWQTGERLLTGPEEILVLIPARPSGSQVTLGQSAEHPESQFPHLFGSGRVWPESPTPQSPFPFQKFCSAYHVSDFEPFFSWISETEPASLQGPSQGAESSFADHRTVDPISSQACALFLPLSGGCVCRAALQISSRIPTGSVCAAPCQCCGL